MLSMIGTIIFCAAGTYVAVDCLYLIYLELTTRNIGYTKVITKLIYEQPDDFWYLTRTYGMSNVIAFCIEVSKYGYHDWIYDFWFMED